MQPCPTAQELFELNDYLLAFGLIIKDALDIIESGTVPSLMLHAI
jgi:hypothetical protein